MEEQNVPEDELSTVMENKSSLSGQSKWRMEMDEGPSESSYHIFQWKLCMEIKL